MPESNRSPRLLVSVRDLLEARLVLRTTAHVVDIKNPDRGPLGMASLTTLQSIADEIGGQKRCSAALGEWHEAETLLESDAPKTCLRSLDFLKCGWANAAQDWQSDCARIWQAMSRFARPVAVAYADHHCAKSPSPEDLFAYALQHGVTDLLLDTYDKNGKSVFDVMSLDDLTRLCQRFGAMEETMFVLAGSLQLRDISLAVKLPIDMLGVRGAVCKTGRSSTLSPQKVQRFQFVMSEAYRLRTSSTF